MNNTKTAKRALLSSVMAMLICITMLIGTTFAWFTDSASMAVNKIQAGTLEVQLLDAQGHSLEGQTLAWQKAAGHESDEVLWEPGCTYKLQPITIKNTGNLALKYKIVITGIQGDAELNEAIEWTINDADLSADHSLAAGASVTLTIQGHMKEEAGNEYQGRSIDGIGITVVATQDTVEHDSFDDQYDVNAVYPVMTSGDLVASLKKKNNIPVLGMDMNVSKTISLTQSGKNYLNLNGHELTSDYIAGTTANKSAVVYYRAPIVPTGTLTISGEGSVIGKDGNYAVGVERGTVNITGGTYEGSATAIYAIGSGKVNISGGHFRVQHTPGDMDACKFTINKYDSSTSAKITITGGTFENFNPADNTADGAGTNYVADGYTVVSEPQSNGDIWYTVVPD